MEFFAEAYGLDAAVRHGALVKALWRCGGFYPVLCEYKVLYRWEDLPSGGEDLKYMHYFGDKILRHMPAGVITRCGIDHDSTSVFWGGHPIQAINLAYLFGYLAHGLRSVGVTPLHVQPIVVRSVFNLKPGATKMAVWRNIPSLPKDVHEDVKDALVLSYIVASREEIPVVKSLTAPTLARKRAKRAVPPATTRSPAARARG